MISVSEGFKNACKNGWVENQFTIIVFGYYENENLYIENKNIIANSMAIEQALSDEADLKFGGAVAGSFEIEISNMPDLTGRYITVMLTQKAMSPLYPGTTIFPGATLYPGYVAYTQSFYLFSGEVYSCKFTKNRLTRKLVAYDRFYWRGSIDCTKWYRTLYSSQDERTLYDIRKAVCEKFRLIEADDTVTLPADNLLVKMIDGSVTVGDLLRMICEFNGCFIYFNGGGNLVYCNISADTHSDEAAETYDYSYKNAVIEDFTKEKYTGIYFKMPTDFLAWDFRPDYSTDNLYYEENSLITSGYDEARYLYGNINSYDLALKPNFNIDYTPMELTAATRLWVELGDRISFKMRWYSIETVNGIEQSTAHDETVYSYVLSRRITGTQFLMDEINARGENIKYTEESFSNNS